MAKIIHKKSSVVGKIPAVGDLDFGELALNYADGKLFYKASNNSIQSFGGAALSNSVRQQYTATAGQTTFNITYTPGYVDVYLNGVKLLVGTDFTATNGTSIILATGAAVGDIVDIVAGTIFASADWQYIINKPTTLSGFGITDAQPLDADLTAISAVSGNTGFLRKIAADTWQLDTNTYLTGNQNIVLSGDVSGNGTTGISVTLANSGVVAGTYSKVMVDAKGRVTAGYSLQSSDLPTYTGTITSSQVTTALGFTPYNSTNPSGYISGNQTITFSGDATGSGATSVALTLANSGVTAGTYTKITVDSKGRATSGTTLSASDIPSLDASKITSGVIDAARLPSYVDDVLEYANLAALPTTGETGKIYLALDTNKAYRWSGSAYVYITSGAVDSVAGKTGVVTLTAADVGIGSATATGEGLVYGSTAFYGNTAVGSLALQGVTGTGNTALGSLAYRAEGGSTGTSNTIIGETSATNLAAGSNNATLGHSAGRALSSGSQNVILGSRAGWSGTNNLTTGSNNIIIGYNAAASSATVSNEVTIGNSSSTNFRFWGALSVGGSNAGTAGQVLTSAGSGAAPTWSTISLTSSQVTTALGFTPYNSTNPNGYITNSALGNYLPLTGGTLSGSLYLSANAQGAGVNSTLRVNGDITAARGNGNSGVIFLGSSGSTYVYYDGVNYYMPSGGLINNGQVVLRADNYSSYALPLSGGTMSGDITFSNGRKGLVGVYDASQTQAIFAMGPSYVLTNGGASGTYGNFYGLGWSYNPDYGGAGNNPQSKPNLGHQLLLMMAGITRTAIGTGIWTDGTITATGNVTATGTGTFNGITINQERASNARIYSATTGSMGLLGVDSGGTFRWQIYGDSSSYGFLDATWGNWDIQKAVNGELDLRVSATTRRVLHAGNYSSYALPLSGGTLSGHLLTNAGVTVSNSDGTAGYGINLYAGNGYRPTYGIFFAQTGTFGTHGSVTADWATYFTMNSTTNRGWIFRNQDSAINVASITNSGKANFNESVTTPLVAASSRINFGSNREYFIGSVYANGTQALRYEIARIYIDYNDWHGAGTTLVELQNKYYYGGDRQVYSISFDYNVVSCDLIESIGPRGRAARVVCSSPTQVSGDYYYISVYVDAQYYNTYDVYLSTSWPEVTSHGAHGGNILVYQNPSGSNIADFSTVENVVMRANSLTLSGNAVLHASNYNSYALPLSGGTLSGAIRAPQITAGGSTNTDANLGVQGTAHITGTMYWGGAVGSVNSWSSLQTSSAGTHTFSGSRFVFDRYGYGSQALLDLQVNAITLAQPTTVSSTLNVTGNTLRQGNNLARPLSMWGAGGTSTGMVYIEMPGNTNNYGMVHAVIDVYEYNGNAAATIIIGGHNWYNSWYNVSANVIGKTDKQVRLAVRNGKFVICIGTASSTWSYGQVILRKISNGTYYDNIMDMAGNFVIAQTTSEDLSGSTGDLRQLSTPASFSAGGTIYSNGYAVVTEASYASYALPLSGGTVSGSINVNSQINFGPDVGWSSFVRGQNHPDQGYTGSGQKYWVEIGSYGGTHVTLNMDGGASAGENGYDHFTIWQAAANSSSGSRQFYVSNIGNVWARNNITAYSDERVKKDWAPLVTDFVTKLAAVKSGSYTRIDYDVRQVGVSAQSIREVLPEAVTEDKDGMLSVAYGNAALAASVELAKRVVKQDQKIAELTALVQKLLNKE